ncbi:MAG TPA: aminotransferase class I/II-fold pyridoxal phosphate-dependent enzyme, partial [Opitutaceae bacterium]|nr:aminotransferase class I/II-fold pyridoxal phosphate-dependent enzyme [Opitutaceae bacterium]
VHQHLVDHDLDAHIAKVRELYGRQRNAMVEAIRRYFPTDAKSSEPDGGMFLWVRLPEGVSAMALFNAAIARKVAFVPGSAFFVEPDDRHLRLNFSNSDEAQIEEGMRRLGAAMSELLARR